jgi:single-stranded DNA-binding protein
MSAYALITGVIFRAPQQKTAKTGKLFTTCTVKVGSDDSASSDFWNVLAFSDTAQAELLRLRAGDALSAQGSLKVELYQKDGGEVRISRTIFANAVLALRAAPKERKPTAKAAPTSQEQSTTTTDPGLDDDLDGLPF